MFLKQTKECLFMRMHGFTRFIYIRLVRNDTVRHGAFYFFFASSCSIDLFYEIKVSILPTRKSIERFERSFSSPTSFPLNSHSRHKIKKIWKDEWHWRKRQKCGGAYDMNHLVYWDKREMYNQASPRMETHKR